MTRLVVALTRADLRTAPGRAAAVAALLAAAAALPGLVTVGTGLGLVLAGAVSAAAAAGSAAQHAHRRAVLELNGAGPGLEALAAAAAMVVPGLAGALLAGAIGTVTGGPVLATVLLLAVAVPVVAAPLATLTWAPRRRRPGRTVLVAVAVVVLAPTVVVPMAALAALVGRSLARAGPAGRAAGCAVAALLLAGAASLVGTADTWFDVAILLTVVAVPLALAAGWVGTSALGLTGALLGRMGPSARLAVAPLGPRRALLTPLAAALTVVATLAVMEAVVGASLGAREAERLGPVDPVGQAGLGPDQAVAVLRAVDPGVVRRAATEAAARHPGVGVAVIDRLGDGGTEVTLSPEVSPPSAPIGLPPLRLTVPPAWTLDVTTGPTWVGVATGDDLAALGLARHAAALVGGSAVVLAPSPPARGRVTLTGPGGPRELPAVSARPADEGTAGDEATTAWRLPAALVSPAVADALGAEVRAARVVAVAPGSHGAATATARAVVEAVEAVEAPEPEEEPGAAADGADGADGADLADLEAVLVDEAIVPGDRLVYPDRGGPLNAVPYLAGTRDEGRGRIAALAGLTAVVAVAGALLALGGTRAEDRVLQAQGATTGVRALGAAVGATALAGTAAVLGGLLGVGLPALAFEAYNGRSRTGPATNIPLVVGWEVPAALVGLVAVAALLAAVATAARRAPGTGSVTDPDLW